MTLLVGFTVAGYLTISSYWGDATAVSTAAAQPLEFPYLKARTLFAYWTNPPVTPDEEFPPPRRYAPVFNDAHLEEIAHISGVADLSVALEQTAFSRFGNTAFLSIEPQAPLWQALELVSGRFPQSSSEVVIPLTFAGEAELGEVLDIKIVHSLLPRTFRMDGTIADTPDPAPFKKLTVVGVYEPLSMISGLVGHLPVNRVGDYPKTNPGRVAMDWPVPNTIYLRLTNPKDSANVSAIWFGMYRDFPGANPPLIPPMKVEWHPSLPEDMIRQAAGAVATPLFANTLNAFSLGAIGIFAAMFTSFLDRRKELGIMKTVGIDNNHTAGAVSLEVVFAGVLGTVFGTVAALVIATYFLKGVSGNAIQIQAGAVLTGAVVSALVLLAATYIPRAMAKQGTVMELLYGRAIPIVRNRR